MGDDLNPALLTAEGILDDMDVAPIATAKMLAAELNRLRSSLSAAREEARRIKEGMHVDADLGASLIRQRDEAVRERDAAREEARRLTERAAGLQRNWDEASSAATRLVHERDGLTARLDSTLREYHDAIDRADRAESSARRLRGALVEWVEALRSLREWMHDKSTARDDVETDRRYARVEAAESAARAALGSSPGDTKGETT